MNQLKLTVLIATDEDPSTVLDELQLFANELTNNECIDLITETACVDTSVNKEDQSHDNS